MPGPSQDPGEFLAAARAGSRDALGQALELCRGYLLHIANDGLAPELRSKGGASDLVQDTFLDAQRDFCRFHGSSDAELRAWLRQLLLHNAANFARSYRETGKRQVGREISLGRADIGGALAAEIPSPSGEAMAREQAEALQRALERLPEDYRRVIILRNQERRSFEEIGALMARSAYAVRRLWARAVERLQQEVEKPP
jgi:RNA polymerase sigma-70 factor, ECF subfamily